MRRLFVISLIFGCAHNAPRHDGFAPALVAISVRDLASAESWYGRNAGFVVTREIPLPDAHMTIAILSRGGFDLELVQLDGSVSPASVVPGDNPARLRGFGKLAFRVDAVDAVAARLKANGVRFQMQPRDNPADGSRSFIVLDDDGNWIQFIGPMRHGSASLEPAFAGIYVADAEKAARWYAEVLGYRIVKPPATIAVGVRMAMLERADSRIELIEAAGWRGIFKIGFDVDDVDAMAARLKRDGVRIVVPPFDDPQFGVRSFIAADPDGNNLQFFSPLRHE
jgi:catechol 2,3-dioxygenase-like lactoylglutathione lyase family enzyme